VHGNHERTETGDSGREQEGFGYCGEEPQDPEAVYLAGREVKTVINEGNPVHSSRARRTASRSPLISYGLPTKPLAPASMAFLVSPAPE
jgi:hypothetical protein